jgi:transposase
MRLQISKSPNAASFYVVKSIYTNKKRTNKIVEKLGTYDELLVRLNGEDPYKWAKEYVADLNRKEKEGVEPAVMAKFSPNKIIEKDIQNSKNGGYLVLQKIYYDLGLDKIANSIKNRHNFEYDLNSILSRLLYSRIIHPSSKLKTSEISKNFIEPPKFEAHQIYRALDVLYKEKDYIQSELYRNSKKIMKRNDKILYYDCTNYYFEIEEASGKRQYGVSKENRPNPIVEMGLFMDANGLPLAFSMHSGNTNEQKTLQPLEKKILEDFNLSKFVVCTDAGLSSLSNRKFNSKGDRAYITTQSIKKLKGHLKEWALDKQGWSLSGSNQKYDISMLEESDLKDKVFYKERWTNENNFEEKLVVTFSQKYKEYQSTIRQEHINRAMKTIKENPSSLKKHRQTDYKRLIEKTHITPDGEVAQKDIYTLNEETVEKEAIYDGFYAVCTSLHDKAEDIVKINKNRWQIEECFRIMKTEFKARPVYLSRDERIEAHFLTCFIALLIFRILVKQLGDNFTCEKIIDTLKNMNFYQRIGDGFIPTYTRTDLTDSLHETFDFRTDLEIVTEKQMKKIIKSLKK